MEKKLRYPFIDGLRGFAIVNMILFHFCYDVFMVYGKNPLWYASALPHIWQQCICWLFIFISGFVWQWGKKKALKRGLLLNICGLIITAVTVIFMPGEPVWFGILNFSGCAVLVLMLIAPAIRNIPAWAGCAGSFILFGICKNVQNGTLGWFGHPLCKLPQSIYAVKVLTPFGFPYPSFVSSDYFPLLPWFFLFLCGHFVARIFEQTPKAQKIATKRVPILSCIGRYSLPIYMLHQPICMAICMLMFS